MIFIGDIHTKFEYLNKFKNKNLIQAGDFGYWPEIIDFKSIKFNSNIYFCDGNHENHWELKKLWYKRTETKIIENIFYMPRLSYKNIEGYNILFIGGAESIDKNRRTIGFDWFPEETISYNDMLEENFPQQKIDIIVSHTCPLFCFKIMNIDQRLNDPSCIWLQEIYSIYKPKYWYFGHFHFYKKFQYENCTFTCLNMVDDFTNDWHEEF